MLAQWNLAMVDTTATVHETAIIGEGTTIWGNSYIGKGATIGKHCTIGRTVEIGAGVTIGDNCKVEAGAQVHPGWTIGDNVFIGPCAVFCNDNDPQAVRGADNPFVPLNGLVGAGVTICANCTIIGGLIIGDNAKVWPGAVVTRDVPAQHSARAIPAENKYREPKQVACECKSCDETPTGKQVDEFKRIAVNLIMENLELTQQLIEKEKRVKQLSDPSPWACMTRGHDIETEYNKLLDEIFAIRKKLGLPPELRNRMWIR